MRLVKPSYEILSVTDGPIKLIEVAGRTCYKSEEKITDDSADRFVEMVTKREHNSVIEHANMTVRFVCDRGVTHELVRHRLAAYSQESTRYCNYKGGVTFIIPPWIDIIPGIWSEVHSFGEGWSFQREPDEEHSEYISVQAGKKIDEDRQQIDWPTDRWLHMMQAAETSYMQMLKEPQEHQTPYTPWTPQQARSVLPNSLKTEIVMTTNFREWLHVFKLRTSKAAHPQIKEIMEPLQAECRKRWPAVFGKEEKFQSCYLIDQGKTND